MLLLSGFRTGFYLNYTGLRLPLQPKNMKSADVHNSELLAIINEKDILVAWQDLSTIHQYSILDVFQ